MKSVLIILLAVAMLTGCARLLEGDIESITPHEVVPYERPPTEQISVADHYEFRATMLDLIMQHVTETQILYHNYDGEDVQAAVRRVCDEIMYEHPIGAYAVANIAVNATRVVAYFEVDIEIEFKRTHEQIASIVNVSTQRYMVTQLLSSISEYKEEAVIRTSMQLSEEEITELVKEIYYQNPRRIVMLPFVAVDIFPEVVEILPDEVEDPREEDENYPDEDEDHPDEDEDHPEDDEGFPDAVGGFPNVGVDRIYEIKFGYMEGPSMLQVYSENLALYVRQNAERAVGDTDAEILLSLVENLMASTAFDEGTARTISIHGAQNFAATAFGALVRGQAVGEGFAMAFKALCDELRFDCRVVLGYIDGRVHAWNIIFLDGYYYHIDVAMAVVNGLETAFLKTDADFEEMYTWDRENTVRCEGSLTLEDIIGPADPDDDDDYDDDDDDYDDDDHDNGHNEEED